jgi:DNA-binding LacI/PurR family transcriptional regulator
MSTIDPSKDEIAERAVSLLIERINDPDAPVPARDVSTSFRVVQRESTTV